MQTRARDEIRQLAEDFEVSADHPADVVAEAERWLQHPGLDDPALEDARHRPFVTIDNLDSRDLDQAVFIEPLGAGFRLHYALADASYYVRRGTRLYAEALSRGASYYLPGFVAPMLPVSLSEGLVSLNPAVDRRALTFIIELDAAGEVTSTRIVRQLVHSRAKLTYAGVQAFWDARDRRSDAAATPADPLENQEFTDSLLALRELGKIRIALAEARGVVHYPRIEVDIGFADAEGRTFTAFESHRYESDRANEQVSLLVNTEGARFLEHHASSLGKPSIAAIYRVHPAPDPKTFITLAAISRRLIRQSGLPKDLAWDADDESIATWMTRLHDRLGRHPVALALQRQALLINQRSSFAAEPGLHFGVGAPCYARFSSPMREIVGIHTHQEALEALGLEPSTAETDADRQQIIDAANESKDRQNALTKLANQRVIEALLRPDLELAPADRASRQGIVIGLTSDKAFVLLDEPPLELKVYARDLGERFQLEGNTTLDIKTPEGSLELTLGDRVALTVIGFDTPRDRFQLSATVTR